MSIEDDLVGFGVLSPEQQDSRERHFVVDAFHNRERPVKEGSFLWYMIMAFEKADSYNFDLLLPVIQQVLKKYKYDKCTCPPDSSSRLRERFA